MPKIGDRVRFLNTTGGGIIKRIEGNIAYVDDDGFETPTLLRECVVVAEAAETARKVAATQEAVSAAAPMTPEKAASAPLPDETPEGWKTRYAGVVEPNIQVFLEEIEGTELPQMDRVAVQMIAFKMEREFRLKSPVAIETPLDTTKFFKLHCFRQCPYFDKDVIAIELVRDDVVRQRSVIDSSRIEEGIKAKKAADRQAKRPVVKHKREQRKGEIIEVDLHVGELLDTTAGLTPADILNLQIDEFRKVMDANLRNKGQKIVFIHGKGEGVLRNALMKELNHRYKGHRVQDASFREYGFGATQVTI